MKKRLLTALVGDVVSSRSHPEQALMLESLRKGLKRVNSKIPALQPLRPGSGDEFQGLYQNLADALKANMVLPLELAGQLEVRVGIGQGCVEVLSDQPIPQQQSGPAWWFAREAIDEIKALIKGWPAGTRSRFRSDDDALTGLVNAFLICQDQIISRMDKIDARITTGILAGARQKELEKALGITQSTISARQRLNGPAALARAFDSFREGMGQQ